MKHIVIGTAGHVDHGKTCLTKALTGVDTDRLKEEKKRGITIEIGFAQLTLPNGQTASIVDVPGHERLIRNMLVGASGIDIVLMVIAADEGCMPQTREHLEILSLLGVQTGLIVITKTDMVEEDWLEIVKEDIADQVTGTFLEGVDMIPVSSSTGAGIDALKAKIVSTIEQTPARTVGRPFRLPVDRAFTIKGFGTVVTGTLVDGTLQNGGTVMVYPQQKTARVRELQNHEIRQETVEAGMRVAVNLTGIDKQELMRGCTIAQPDSMLLSRQITVRLELVKDTPFEVKNASQLHFYQGTQELLCRVRLLDVNILRPGERCYAQLFFDEPLTARNLDKFIVRFFSPMTTVGGGVILDMEARKLRRSDPEVLKRLERLEHSPETRILQMVCDARCALLPEEHLIRLSGLSAPDVRDALVALSAAGTVLEIGGGLISDCVLEETWSRTEALLQAYHKEQPLKDGLPLGELREKIFSDTPKTADAIMNHFSTAGKLSILGACAALKEFKPTFSKEHAALRSELEALYEDAGYEPPLNEDVAQRYAPRMGAFQQVFARMQQDGTLVALTPQTVVHADRCRQALDVFVAMFQTEDAVALGDFRTKLGVSRKYAQMYLDYFDKQKISKMVGDRRILLPQKN